MESRNVTHLPRLVIVAPNWLGDAVMALPAIADVRRAWPDARIGIVARPAIAPLFTLMPGVDAVSGVLRGADWDGALLLPNSFHAAFSTWRSGIGERWGYRADGRSPLLTRAVRRPSGVHQTVFYQYLVRQLGFPNGSSQPRMEIPQSVRDAGAAILRTNGWDEPQPLMAMAPGAAYGSAKRWPASSFAGVAAELARRDNARIVLIGSAGDRSAGDDVLRGLTNGSRPVDLIGATDLVTLAGVLAHCRGLVTNDSGAMHLAAAAGIRVTAVFGPTNENETRPLGPETTVINADVWCRPCMLRDCPLTHRCMRKVSVNRVLTSARRSLAPAGL